MSRRFVLLDRDGTINVENNYLSNPDDLELVPGTGAGLRRLRELGLGLAVVTNQSGIGRGYFTLETVGRVHDRMREMLRAEGVEIDGIYLCPHAPTEECNCRKPRPGMVEQAVAELGFDPKQAFLIGDKAIDIALGQGVGATSILVRTGYGVESESMCKPDAVTDDLPAAAVWIEQHLASAPK